METYNKLTEDFPQEALSKDSSRGFDLTSIKAQYIKERLNEVFGIWGWEVVGKHEATTSSILYFGKLIVRVMSTDKDKSALIRVVESVGYSMVKKNLGDSYKSAQTDFLSKAASFIGIGNEVFKGNVTPTGQNTAPQAQKRAPKPDYDTTDPGAYIIKIAVDKKGSEKLQGKMLRDADINLMKKCCDFWTSKDIKGALKTDIDKMNEYIRYISSQRELDLK